MPTSISPKHKIIKFCILLVRNFKHDSAYQLTFFSLFVEPLQVHRVGIPTLEKSQSLQGELAQQRPQSMLIASQSEANVIVNPQTGSLHRQVSPVRLTPTNLCNPFLHPTSVTCRV